MNVSKPREHSLNTKKCVVNVSARYLWRDYYAKKNRELCHKMCLAMLAIGPIHCFRMERCKQADSFNATGVFKGAELLGKHLGMFQGENQGVTVNLPFDG